MSESPFYPPRRGSTAGLPTAGLPTTARPTTGILATQGYPPQQGPPPGYPPQQGLPHPGYPPQQGPPPGYAPQRIEPQGVAVIPIVGTGGAKIAARLGMVITVNGQGFSASSKKHSGWQIDWRELRRVTITRAYHQARGRIAPRVWRIRLVMDAIDPSFPQRHPDLARGEGKNGGTGPGSFGVPLGPVQKVVDPLAQALGHFGGGVFAGVIDEGQLLGFGYL